MIIEKENITFYLKDNRVYIGVDEYGTVWIDDANDDGSRMGEPGEWTYYTDEEYNEIRDFLLTKGVELIWDDSE